MTVDTRFDEIATHFLLRLTPSLKPIGTVRTFRPPGVDYYKLSRLAVHKDYRKFGFGRALVSAMHDWIEVDSRRRGDTDSAEIVSHSQVAVKGFYARCVAGYGKLFQASSD